MGPRSYHPSHFPRLNSSGKGHFLANAHSEVIIRKAIDASAQNGALVLQPGEIMHGCYMNFRDLAMERKPRIEFFFVKCR